MEQLLNNKLKINYHSTLSYKFSESTKSLYIILKDKAGYVYQLAVSDHKSPNHSKKINGNFIEIIKMILKEKDYQYWYSLKESMRFYSFRRVEPYHFYKKTANDLIGNYAVERVFNHEISDVRVVKADLIENEQVLKIEYANKDIELYVNYLPVTFKEVNKKKLVVAYFLGKNKKRFRNIRTTFYKNRYKAYSEEEFLQKFSCSPQNESIETEVVIAFNTTYYLVNEISRLEHIFCSDPQSTLRLI